MTMENVRTCDCKMYKRPIIKITDGKLEYEIWKKASEKRKWMKVVCLIIFILISALFLEDRLLDYVNNRNIRNTSEVLLDQVAGIIERNTDDEKR